MPHKFIDKDILASGSAFPKAADGKDGAYEASADSIDACASEDASRKKRGLLIFAVLITLTLACAVAFFMSSKHLTMAAAFLDETVGTMESYTVVLFKGTTDVDPQDVIASKDIEANLEEGLSNLPPSNTMQEAFSSDSNIEKRNGFDVSDFIMSLFARASKQTESDREKLFVSDINDIYSSKGAQTLTINVADLDRYSKPMIFDKGGKRIAIFSIQHYISRVKLNEITQDLRDDGVEFIIAITPRTELVSTFDEIDTCIVTSAEDAIEERASKKTLVAQSPSIEEIGALIITSNNVANMKTIKEL